MVTVTAAHRVRFAYAALGLELLFIILFATTTDYGSTAQATGANDIRNTATTEVDHYYPLFQDVHVMIFIGFGFLMTFLKRYGFGAVGFNFMLSAMIIQWSMLTNGFFHSILATSNPICEDYKANKYKTVNYKLLRYGDADPFSGCSWHKIELGITNLVTSDFAAGAVMISFGAILGKAGPTQLMFMGMFEILFYGINETIGAGVLGAVDMGGSIFVHTFGAYFGLAVSLMMAKKPAHVSHDEDHPDNGAHKTSDTFAMVGTIFLWMFWPSFNGALATESQQHRVIINTVLALSACCMSAFAFSALLRKHNKFDMVDIQNATLAGGVAVGSSADLVIQPYGAIIIGLVAGALSVCGYVYVQPYLAEKIGLDDTCGVHNLHGMPGIMGALGGAISSAVAGDSLYGSATGIVFPQRCGTWMPVRDGFTSMSNSTDLYNHIMQDGNGTFNDFAGTNKTWVDTEAIAQESIANGNPAHAISTMLLNNIKATTGCSTPGEARSASVQAAMQFCAVCVTVAIAMVGGLITGSIMKCMAGGTGQADYNNWYDDSQYWEVEHEEEEAAGIHDHSGDYADEHGGNHGAHHHGHEHEAALKGNPASGSAITPVENGVGEQVVG